MNAMTCKHQWRLLSETVTESQLEHAMRASNNLLGPATYNAIAAFGSNRKHIQVFSCDKCGKLKRFVEDI